MELYLSLTSNYIKCCSTVSYWFWVLVAVFFFTFRIVCLVMFFFVLYRVVSFRFAVSPPLSTPPQRPSPPLPPTPAPTATNTSTTATTNTTNPTNSNIFTTGLVCVVNPHVLTLFAALSSRPSSTKRLYKVRPQHSNRVSAPIVACTPTICQSAAVVKSVQLPVQPSSPVVVRYRWVFFVIPLGLDLSNSTHVGSMTDAYKRVYSSRLQHEDMERANTTQTHKKNIYNSSYQVKTNDHAYTRKTSSRTNKHASTYLVRNNNT